MSRIEINPLPKGEGKAQRAVMSLVDSDGAKLSQPIGWYGNDGSILITEPKNIFSFLADVFCVHGVDGQIDTKP